MIIQIEDYFGNDVLRLNYCQILSNITDNKVKLVNEIAEVNGYNVADIEGDHIRVQQHNVDVSEEEQKEDLIELVSKLNKQFI